MFPVRKVNCICKILFRKQTENFKVYRVPLGLVGGTISYRVLQGGITF